MADLHTAGGLPILMKELLDAGLLHGDCLTVTGKTVAENLASVSKASDLTQDVVYPISKPLSPPGHHITIIKVRWIRAVCILTYAIIVSKSFCSACAFYLNSYSQCLHLDGDNYMHFPHDCIPR